MNKFALIILASFFLLSACGQKGPLYLPGTESSDQSVEDAQKTEGSEDSEDTEESDNTEESSSDS